MALDLSTPAEMAQSVAQRARSKRLSLNISQQTLSDRSGVSYSSIRKFERTGQVSFQSLLKLALVLDALDEFHQLFPETLLERAKSLDELMTAAPRKRGRK